MRGVAVVLRGYIWRQHLAVPAQVIAPSKLRLDGAYAGARAAPLLRERHGPEWVLQEGRSA